MKEQGFIILKVPLFTIDKVENYVVCIWENILRGTPGH